MGFIFCHSTLHGQVLAVMIKKQRRKYRTCKWGCSLSYECTGRQTDTTSILGCPSRTKFWSSDFCFAAKFFQNFPTSGKIKKILLSYSARPWVNFDRKHKVDLHNVNFVPEGHPIVLPCCVLNKMLAKCIV